MADNPEVCGERDCVLSYGADGRHGYAPAGTPFRPGVVVGKFIDDPTPEPGFTIDPPLLVGLLLLLIADFGADRWRRSIRARSGPSGSA